MEGLRNFIKVDNQCALDAGHLNEGTRSYELRWPKLEEECTKVSITEVPEELTISAEEVLQEVVYQC